MFVAVLASALATSVPASATTTLAVCDHQPASYPSPPPAAVIVNPAVDNDLYAKTDTNPPGTTFWLGPGRHTLGADPLGQVIPKAGDAYLGAPGAVLDGRRVNRFAFTQDAPNVTIRNLTVQGFAAPPDQGVVNHDSADGWVVENSTIQDNRGAGLMAGAHQQVRHDCLRDNGQYGMNAYQDGNRIVGLLVEGNEIVGNNTDDWETQLPGCGCTGGIKFWAVNGADVRGNWIHHNHGPALWADTNNNDFLIEGNLIEDNEGEAIFYEISYNLVVRANVVRRNTWVTGRAFALRGDNFPVAAVYLSESGGEPRVPARVDKIDIYGNLFDDNWSGITLWENADRFCGSPANTSGGSCTRLVDTVSRCTQPGIAGPPLYDDCRWKTQRVDIHGNVFRFDPARIGCGNGLCGRMAVLSNYGSYPDWSPYRGTVVQDAITSAQWNSWHGNTYAGPWTFMPHDVSQTLDATGWRAFGQDACSSFIGGQPTC
jgi:parallel beta helix pectate lyase-like protein